MKLLIMCHIIEQEAKVEAKSAMSIAISNALYAVLNEL